MRFLPQIQVIKAGDSITWTNNDPMMPHTVTLPGENSTFSESFAPEGSSTYDGKIKTSSGILLPSQTYTLKFTNPGRYTYICLLHDEIGMIGTIIVLP